MKVLLACLLLIVLSGCGTDEDSIKRGFLPAYKVNDFVTYKSYDEQQYGTIKEVLVVPNRYNNNYYYKIVTNKDKIIIIEQYAIQPAEATLVNEL